MKRSIRLYEYAPLLERTFSPSDSYMMGVIPNLLEARPYKVRTNELGAILPSIDRFQSPRKLSVILGDSVPECLFVDEDSRIESVLSKLNGNNSYLNFAYSGATSLDILNIFFNKVIALAPAKVFFMAGVFDEKISKIGFFSNDKRVATVDGLFANEGVFFNDFFKSREVFLKCIFSACNDLGIDCYVGTFGHRHHHDDPYEKFCNYKNPDDNLLCTINSQTKNWLTITI
ncbi:SGNH/GDSL hydrolase family protein [Limnohabitans sp. TS-CS-82]|uniref:SGNH/GDSL hydrolase family protein n=1 Tax=Limnohabitans sp. TS-CS-82 TaxID=2094193 RepID=UPI0011B00A1C|nr:SGNH/GDSL hydrolase family protein [Limnohabitans sp. TS-CS-82]